MTKYTYEQEKFNEKYNKYCTLIYRTAYQYLFNADAAEDIVQEVFVKLFTHHKSFNDDEHEKAWLLRITINLCKNALKSKSNNNLTFDDEIRLDDNSFEDTSDTRIDIVKSIKALTPEQRAVIYLYYYEGFTVKEIARITKCKENTVKSHLKRARQALKNDIERD